MDPVVTERYLSGYINLFRAPIANIVKKANRQIRETKKHLSLEDHRWILLCVNDDFRELPPRLIMALIARILLGSYSSIAAFIYLTNHYVRLPGVKIPVY